MNIKPFQLQPQSTIASDLIAGSTSITVLPMIFPDGTYLQNSTFSQICGDIACATLDQGDPNIEEQITFTGITDNSNGTYTLTGVQSWTLYSTGGGSVPTYTPYTGIRYTHIGNRPLIFSNNPIFFSYLLQTVYTPYTGTGLISVNASNVISFTGFNTIGPSLTVSNGIIDGTPATSTQLGMIKIGNGLNVGTDGTISTNSIPVFFTAGANLSQYEPVYMGGYTNTPITLDTTTFDTSMSSGISRSTTIGNNPNRVLVAICYYNIVGSGSLMSPSTPTLAGNAMTSVGSAYGQYGGVGIYYTSNPNIGANTFTWNITNPGGYSFSVRLLSYYNCSIDTIHGNANSYTVTNNYQDIVIGAGWNNDFPGSRVTNSPLFTNYTFDSVNSTQASYAGGVSDSIFSSGTYTMSGATNYFNFTLKSATTTTNGLIPASSHMSSYSQVIGFTQTSATQGSQVSLFTNGFIPVNTTSGAIYYLQDTAGTIGTNPGTISKKVGIGTGTQLAIQLS